MDLPPTAADVARYMGMTVPVAGSPEEQALADALHSGLRAQAKRCDTTDYGLDLAYAALRRAARTVAARSAPLGVVDLGELATTRIPAWDAEIESLEAPYRLGPIA